MGSDWNVNACTGGQSLCLCPHLKDVLLFFKSFAGCHLGITRLIDSYGCMLNYSIIHLYFWFPFLFLCFVIIACQYAFHKCSLCSFRLFSKTYHIKVHGKSLFGLCYWCLDAYVPFHVVQVLCWWRMAAWWEPAPCERELWCSELCIYSCATTRYGS